MSRFRVELMLLVSIVALGAALHRSNLALESYAVARKSQGDVGTLPDGKALRVASLGYDRLLADLFWLRTVYYIGDEHSHSAGYPAAGRLAELVTDIDPRFRTVYSVMQGALSGLAGDPDAAIRLLEKGVAHVDYWRLNFYLGFNYFFERLDFARAAEQMDIAASKEGGPPYLPLLASRLYAQAGQQDTAMLFIRKRLEEAATPEEKETLEKRFWDLWITRDLARIDGAADAYRADRGVPVSDVGTLVSAGLLEEAPRDPQGNPYFIEDGRAATNLHYEVLEVQGLKRQRKIIKQREEEREKAAGEEGA